MLLNRDDEILKIENFGSCAVVLHFHLICRHLIRVGIQVFEMGGAGGEEIAGQAGNDDDSSFGGWGRRFGGQGRQRNDYGRSGAVVTQRRPVAAGGGTGRQEPVRRTEPIVVRRVQPVPTRVSDAEFEPTPILQLRAGQRIEHNRFGFGKILEISGTPADLKAKIAFDDHGEKILILKYAKIRAI